MSDNNCILPTIKIGIPILKDIILAVAALIGAIVAWCGLNTWRRQLEGSSEYEVARNLMRTVYKVQYAIEALRSRAIKSNELPIELKGAVNDLADALIQNTEYVYQMRWKLVNEAMVQFEVDQLEGEILWGEGILDFGNKLRSTVRELESALWLYLQYSSWADYDKRSKEYLDLSAIVHVGINKDLDIYSNKLTSIVADYKKNLIPHLKS